MLLKMSRIQKKQKESVFMMPMRRISKLNSMHQADKKCNILNCFSIQNLDALNVARIIFLCHNLPAKDAMPVYYSTVSRIHNYTQY